MAGFPNDVLTDIKAHLNDEKKRISIRIDELKGQDPFSNPDRINDNAANDAEASEESSHDRFSALVDELKEKLNQIEASLERIKNGSYGFCTNCGDMIDTDRLGILPTATLCLNCEKNRK